MSYNNKIGWRFDNTYSKLPGNMLTKLAPTPVKAPELVILNYSLSKDLGLDFSNISNEKFEPLEKNVTYVIFKILPFVPIFQIYKNSRVAKT